MPHQELMKKFSEKKAHQLGMGGKKKLEARKAAGKMNARERIEYLFDPGTFREIGLFTHSARPEDAPHTPTDGKIIGSGFIQGRLAGTVVNDLTVKGASSAKVNKRKMEYMRYISCEKGVPLVFLGESSGSRMPDSMGATDMAGGEPMVGQYRRLREAPWISVLLGPCFGSSGFYSAMSDINVMLKGAAMGIVSPKVTQLATGEDTPLEELAGWEVNFKITGAVDAVGETERECIDMAKKYLSYLPSHAGQLPPRAEVLEGSGKDMPHILDLVPEKRNRAYDMKKIMKTLVDGGEIFELKAEFGRPCVTAFARLDGYSVGVVANNPMYMAGALDADCCEKITSFLVLCDSFHVPIITLVDTPGFMVGKGMEQKKIMGKIINWMNALALVTVPKLTVIIRKIYGQAYLNMGGRKNSDVFVAWPTAEISFMDPETAVNVVHNVKREDDPARFEEFLGRMSKDIEPFGAAGIFGIEDVIEPAKTRDFLIRMLHLTLHRETGGLSRRLLHNWPTSY